MNKTITFNVKDYFNKQLQINTDATMIANTFAGIKMSEQEFMDKVYDDTTKQLDRLINNFFQSVEEINKNECIINKVNTILDQLKNNIRLKQYIWITQDLSVSNKIYITNNGYFKFIFNPNYICIPAVGYYGHNNVLEEYKGKLDDNYMYVFGEEEGKFKIPLNENTNDTVNYNTNYLEVTRQILLQNPDLKITYDCYYWISVRSANGKINFNIDIEDVCDMFILAHNQKRIGDKWEIDIQQLNKIANKVQKIGD